MKTSNQQLRPLAPLVLLLTGCAGGTPAGGTTARVATAIVASHFVSPSTGWIALSRSVAYSPRSRCANGDPPPACYRGSLSLYKTADAGRHWRRQFSLAPSTARHPAGLPFVSFRFASATVGFAGITFSEGGTPFLLATIDGGSRWNIRQFPAATSFVNGYGLTFIDRRHGWLIANRSEGGGNEWLSIYGTADGGQHWRRLSATSRSRVPPSGLPSYGDKGSLTFITPALGWLSGKDNSGGVELYQTVDGGRHWRLRHLPKLAGDSPNDPSSKQAYPPALFGREHGLFPVAAYLRPVGRAKRQARWRLFLYPTRDGGRPWLRPVPAGTPAPDALQLVDPRHWWMLVGTAVWVSADGGHHWSRHRLPLPQADSPITLQALNASTAWVVVGSTSPFGPRGGRWLLKSTDGGAHWQPVKFPH